MDKSFLNFNKEKEVKKLSKVQYDVPRRMLQKRPSKMNFGTTMKKVYM